MPETTVEGEDIEPRLKLECVASWRLFGWVQVGPYHLLKQSFRSIFSFDLFFDVHLLLNLTEHGQRPADWWGERFTSACFQKCKAFPGGVQVIHYLTI